MDAVDRIGYGNPDTLHAMLLFYILSGLANVDAIHWYEGNIVQLLYPRAKLISNYKCNPMKRKNVADRKAPKIARVWANKYWIVKVQW